MSTSCFKFHPDSPQMQYSEERKNSAVGTNIWESLINGQRLLGVFINRACRKHNFSTLY